MKRSLLLLAPLLLVSLLASGCAGTKFLENRIVQTLDRSSVSVNSRWLGFSIGTDLAATDAAEIKKMQEQAEAYRILLTHINGK